MYRTDLLAHDMNQIKKDQLLDLLKVYQKTAVKIAYAHASRNIVQRRSLLTTGGLYTSVKATLVHLKQVFLRNRGKYARCTTGKYEFPADPMLSNNKFLLDNLGNVKPSFG
jgi:hypothetical protein